MSILIDKASPTVAASYGSYGLGTWTSQSVTATLTATDTGSGAMQIAYTLDGGTRTTVAAASASVVVSTEGTHTLTFAATDKAGNESTWQSASIRIDRTPPTVVANAGGYTFGTWTNRSVTVWLGATESSGGGSGVQQITYTLDGVTTTVAGASASVAVSNEGTHALYFRATDNVGNTSMWQSVSIRIDQTPPIVFVNAGGYTFGTWTNRNVTVWASAADNSGGSGVKQIAYTLDGVTTTVAGASAGVAVSSEGTHTLRFVAMDNAGNTWLLQTGWVRIDRTLPVVTASGYAGTYAVDQRVSGGWSATDALSGVASTSFPADDYAYNFGVGTYSRTGSAIDRAGNYGYHTATFTVTVTITSLGNVLRRFASGLASLDTPRTRHFAGASSPRTSRARTCARAAFGIPLGGVARAPGGGARVNPNQGVADSLVKKLDDIASAPNAEAKAGKVEAWKNAVRAHIGTVFTQAHADILIRLVDSL